MTIKCYSQRLLNPFRGMLCIIEYNSAEAVTMDGIVWDIYVRNSELVKDLEQQHDNFHRIQTSEIRYGRWTKKDGLQRGPTIDSDGFKEMATTGEVVYQYLCQHSEDIPFKFNDNFELWLLDKNNNPLALLNSVVYQEDLEFKKNVNWTSGIACKQKFKSDFFEQNKNTLANTAGDFLNQLVNSQSNNSAQWISRKNDGSGTGLDGVYIDPKLVNRKLSNQDFPSQLINFTIFSKQEQLFINEYYSWLAPWLLVLQSFTDEQRGTLEQQACNNALIVAKQFQLYPKTINSKLIKTALVETMMRNNQTAIVLEKVESVEYLELNNPTHHLNK